jgi:glycosyltransferase involved in cell wall biosynthesis
MAMFGLPLIVSEVDALAEMFEHEETALLTPLIFDPDFGINADKEKFIENIIRLIKDKELRIYLSKNVRISYETRFSLDSMVKNTVDLYKQLI